MLKQLKLSICFASLWEGSGRVGFDCDLVREVELLSSVVELAEIRLRWLELDTWREADPKEIKRVFLVVNL
jgi:5-carboxymethyl-2-hydroxymuconate isomerase